jgi:hypothetical protein
VNTPVAFFIFNRPDVTARVFAEIARARPSQLLVVADGPRPNQAGESDACTAARAIVERVDWRCEVLTNFSERNLGCKARLSSGLDWVFEKVETAIILEDDCLPHPTFFRFCEEVLEKYRDDERIMTINGHSFLPAGKTVRHSYYFSNYVHVWGWASWRRAWQFYDVQMKFWPVLREGRWLWDHLRHKTVAEYWRNQFDEVAGGRNDTWDYQWMFTCWAQNGLAVAPAVNLVSNIGFGNDSSHTREPTSAVAGLPVYEMPFPLSHPPYVIRDYEADDFESLYEYQCALDDVGLNRGMRHHLAATIRARLRSPITKTRF